MSVRVLAGAMILATAASAASGADFSAPSIIPYAEPGGLPTLPWSWTGGYIGAHVGAGRAQTSMNNPLGQLAGTGSLFGDKITAPGGLGGLQVGYNWQAPNDNWVLGIEGAISILDARGSNTCLTENAILVSANCRFGVNSFGIVAARFGYAFGADDRALIFGKIGGGFVSESASETSNYDGQPYGYRNFARTTPAYVIGGGLEYALTPSVSINMEYEHYGMPSFTEATNFYWQQNGVRTYQSLRNQPSFDAVKFGMNYHFENNNLAPWAAAAQVNPLSGVQFEVGARYWYSVGKFQKDLAANSTSSTSLVSRLSYQDKANSGEIFGKVEAQNYFLRGSIADGRLNTSKLNDEDWLGTSEGPSIPYSNTLSTGKGAPRSGIIDVGYNVIDNSAGKLGLSLGYTYLYEQHQAYGCNQLTSLPYICGPGQVAANTLGITETDQWSGLRIGFSGEMQLMDGLRFSTDIAYLPYVQFTGTDNHWLRNLVIKENARGQGTQLQAMLTYDVTRQFSIGAGARYWAMWANSGTDQFNGVATDRNVAYRMERAGAFLQGSYKFSMQ